MSKEKFLRLRNWVCTFIEVVFFTLLSINFYMTGHVSMVLACVAVVFYTVPFFGGFWVAALLQLPKEKDKDSK